jgi:hypothetical protein
MESVEEEFDGGETCFLSASAVLVIPKCSLCSDKMHFSFSKKQKAKAAGPILPTPAM